MYHTMTFSKAGTFNTRSAESSRYLFTHCRCRVPSSHCRLLFLTLVIFKLTQPLDLTLYFVFLHYSAQKVFVLIQLRPCKLSYTLIVSDTLQQAGNFMTQRLSFHLLLAKDDTVETRYNAVRRSNTRGGDNRHVTV